MAAGTTILRDGRTMRGSGERVPAITFRIHDRIGSSWLDFQSNHARTKVMRRPVKVLGELGGEEEDMRSNDDTPRPMTDVATTTTRPRMTAKEDDETFRPTTVETAKDNDETFGPTTSVATAETVTTMTTMTTTTTDHLRRTDLRMRSRRRAWMRRRLKENDETFRPTTVETAKENDETFGPTTSVAATTAMTKTTIVTRTSTTTSRRKTDRRMRSRRMSAEEEKQLRNFVQTFLDSSSSFRGLEYYFGRLDCLSGNI